VLFYRLLKICHFRLRHFEHGLVIAIEKLLTFIQLLQVSFEIRIKLYLLGVFAHLLPQILNHLQMCCILVLCSRQLHKPITHFLVLHICFSQVVIEGFVVASDFGC